MLTNLIAHAARWKYACADGKILSSALNFYPHLVPFPPPHELCDFDFEGRLPSGGWPHSVIQTIFFILSLDSDSLNLSQSISSALAHLLIVLPFTVVLLLLHVLHSRIALFVHIATSLPTQIKPLKVDRWSCLIEPPTSTEWRPFPATAADNKHSCQPISGGWSHNTLQNWILLLLVATHKQFMSLGYTWCDVILFVVLACTLIYAHTKKFEIYFHVTASYSTNQIARVIKHRADNQVEEDGRSSLIPTIAFSIGSPLIGQSLAKREHSHDWIMSL